jgi:DNA uptake protein ComE-like DNA-binding protein
LSGSLALELWALPEVYTGGPFSGVALAGVELGVLAGQSSLERIEHHVAYTQPPAAGRWQAVLMLREWTEAGYRTRDFRNFGPLHASTTIASSAPLVPESAPTKPGQATLVEPELVKVEIAPRVPDNHVSVAAPRPALRELAEPRPAARAPEPLRPTAAPAEPGLVSIQHASVDELAQVKGLNKKLAAEIVKGRPYNTFDDLLKVRGIGDKLLRRLRSELKL